MIKNKKGALLDKEAIEVLLAIAGVILLVILLYNIFIPEFDEADKTSESFFNDFKEQIKIADNGEIGEFLIWDLKKDDKISYHLVYFDGLISYEDLNIVFNSPGNNENHICICSFDGTRSVCNHCTNLASPPLIGGNEVNFVARSGEKVLIKKEEKGYEFFIGSVIRGTIQNIEDGENE